MVFQIGHSNTFPDFFHEKCRLLIDELTRAESFKYLGVILTPNFSWTLHIQHILYCSPVIFPSLMRKAVIVLSSVIKCIGKTACIPHAEFARSVTSKYASAFISFADRMRQDPWHPLHKDLNAQVCRRENGRLPVRSMAARAEAFKNSPLPSLTRFTKSPDVGLQDFYNKLI